MRKNTIQSISEQTGYSVSTVSRVLSGKAQRSRISQKAIEIIKAEHDRTDGWVFDSNFIPRTQKAFDELSELDEETLKKYGLDNSNFDCNLSRIFNLSF